MCRIIDEEAALRLFIAIVRRAQRDARGRICSDEEQRDAVLFLAELQRNETGKRPEGERNRCTVNA